MHSVIIPLVKSKCVSLTDINNYRAIAISSVMSKLFEMLLLDSLSSSSDCDRLALSVDILLACALLCLSRLLIIIEVMEVTFLYVL